MQKFFIAFAVGFVCMFGATVSYACTSDEIDVLGDGTNCQTTKFTLTTTEIADGGTFQFYMSAKGTFYVDCGTGGTLSGTGASGMTITRSNTTGATYTCTYSGNTEAKTIRFGGIAGTAANKPYSTATTAAASVIRFNVTPTLVASVSGSLGALFPTRNATYTPRFRETFSGCTNLTEIPSTLFSDVTGSMTYQFYRTFYGCTSLESIPDGLFSGISGTKTYLFYQTFYNCSGLTGYIPAGMFDKITTYSSNMMSNMFYGTGLDPTCSGTTVQYITGFESYWNGKVSCTEPFVTPVVLDGQSATTTSVPTTVYLKYGTEWDSDLSGTTVISSLTTNPTKTDYIFDGYWTAANGTGTQVIDENGDFISTDATLRLTKTTTTSLTLYANWVQNYTVTYSCGGGTGTPPANGTGTTGKTFTLAANTCTRDGYMFLGWAVSGTSDVKSAAFTWNYTENKTFTAQWAQIKFTVTTIEIASGGEFKFRIHAKGTFYVDCGEGGILSGPGASGKEIIRSSLTTSAQDTTYTCTYTGSTGVKIINFGGSATGYSTDAYAAITFYGNYSQSLGTYSQYLIAGIAGSLGAIFPTLGTANGEQPKFIRTFQEASYWTGSIPENLFSGISGAPAQGMFASTFASCYRLTGSIPEDLFAGISGAPASEMFSNTFRNCSGLTGSIPEDLFAGISGEPAENMFYQTFSGCSGLTGSIPEDLFAGISGAPAQYMFYSTFARCSGLTGSIPSGLFRSLSGAGAQYMFDETFAGCTGLTGYVPQDIFENITSTGSAGVYNMFNGTNLYTECPCGTKPAETGWGDTTVDSRAVCEVGTKDNEHWNNGVCTTDCALGFTKLKSSTGLEYPILSDATGEHNINIGVGGSTCSVPLGIGAANNSLNISFGGATYHATAPDEIVPTGFTGQPAPAEPE